MLDFDYLKSKKAEILRISSKNGIRNIRVFGSVAKGQSTTESDVDFLVELEQGRSLLDLGGFLVEMQNLLGRKVDVVTENGLHWYIKDKIIREARPI
jgi:predicted nucleotidyltransferase